MSLHRQGRLSVFCYRSRRGAFRTLTCKIKEPEIPMSGKINIFQFSDPKIRTLHLAWIAFFLTFVMWFNHAPLLSFIGESMALSKQQIKALLILNVALTIPARIIIGMLVDRFGPRHIYTGLLAISGLLCIGFACATSYAQLAMMRFLMGFIGAGFVIGIRLVGEWFPARTVGLAQGMYGGWGNFGSAAAAMSLPTLAAIYGAASSNPNAWRYTVASTGVLALVYAFVFFIFIRNTPKGATYFKPKKSGGLEVSSWKDLYFYLLMNIPTYGAIAVLVWKLSPTKLGLLPQSACISAYIGLVLLYFFQCWQIWRVNAERLREGVPDMQQYKFKQVAVLDIAYFVTFGSELAVVSMLPMFFMETFELTAAKAGLLASGFAFMNLVARPGGGWISDRLGRRKTLSVLVAGLMVGYFILSQITSGWPVLLAVLATMCCSFFVQAGEGAVFAMVPLVQRRMTGQIAGMAGAYGNVGAVVFLTVFSFVSPSTFFMIIGASAGAVLLACQFIEEPAGHIVEFADDGSVQLIDVA